MQHQLQNVIAAFLWALRLRADTPVRVSSDIASDTPLVHTGTASLSSCCTLFVSVTHEKTARIRACRGGSGWLAILDLNR